MTDENKFRLFTVVMTVLVSCILAYNVLQEYFMTDMVNYLKRRVYYERVIKKEGIPLREGKYWRKLDE